MRFRPILISLISLALFGLPTFVFAQSGVELGQDWRLIALRIFQGLWFVGFLASIGVSGFALYRRKQTQDDLVASARYQSLLLWGGVAAGVSLALFFLLSLVYWGVEHSRVRGSSPQAVQQTDSASLTTFSNFSDFQKVAHVFPENNRKSVPRNVSLFIEFTEAIQPESIHDASGSLLTDRIVVAREDDQKSLDAAVEVTKENTLVTIRPRELLGTINEAEWYAAKITGKVLRANGSPLFSDGAAYAWRFEVSGFSDNTPPSVETFLPIVTSRSAPNTLIQVTFSEPVDPASITPQSFDVRDESGKSVSHLVALGNGFRSALVIPQEACGTNACGDPMYCFPKNSKLSVSLKAAPLSTPPDASIPNRARYPYTGVVDVAGNSLDGGGEKGAKRNGKSEGTSEDDFTFSIQTGDQMDLVQPALYSINPGRDMTKIGVSAPLELQFTKLMDTSTLHTGTISLMPSVKSSIASVHDVPSRRTQVIMTHVPFSENTAYMPSVSSDVRDMSQNCFSQCVGPVQ